MDSFLDAMVQQLTSAGFPCSHTRQYDAARLIVMGVSYRCYLRRNGSIWMDGTIVRRLRGGHNYGVAVQHILNTLAYRLKQEERHKTAEYYRTTASELTKLCNLLSTNARLIGDAAGIMLSIRTKDVNQLQEMLDRFRDLGYITETDDAAAIAVD